jgi:hypothetical protein
MKINTLTVVSSLVVLQNATAFAVPPLGQNVVARSSTTTALAMGNPIDGENIIYPERVEELGTLTKR